MVISAGILFICQKQVLLVRAKQSKAAPTCDYSIPKGIVEAGESLVDAALREALEETGIKVDKDRVDPESYFINCLDKDGKIVKRLYYFIARFQHKPTPDLAQLDYSEVDWAGWVTAIEAYARIVRWQVPLLSHLDFSKVNRSEIEAYITRGFVTKVAHPYLDYYLLNYTKKCKQLQFWNETTLYCRGLIVDKNYNVIARPFKKFFEYPQLYPEFRRQIPPTHPVVQKKYDGSLGILYWHDGQPYITTRWSFCNKPSAKATELLYSRYIQAFADLDPDYTYLFEIIYPEARYTVNYSSTADLYLLAAIHKTNGSEAPDALLDRLPFPRPERVSLTPDQLDCYTSLGGQTEEGFVLTYDNRLKIKWKLESYKTALAEVVNYRKTIVRRFTENTTAGAPDHYTAESELYMTGFLLRFCKLYASFVKGKQSFLLPEDFERFVSIQYPEYIGIFKRLYNKNNPAELWKYLQKHIDYKMPL